MQDMNIDFHYYNTGSTEEAPANMETHPDLLEDKGTLPTVGDPTKSTDSGIEAAVTRPKRSLTPRGPLFPNLDEAHRIITNRLPPKNPFRKSPGSGSSHEEIALQDLSTPPNPNGCDTMNPSHTLSGQPYDFVSAYPSRATTGRCLTNRRQISTHNSDSHRGGEQGGPSALESANEKHATTRNESNLPEDSTSTVGQILVQYATRDCDGLVQAINNQSAEDPFMSPQEAYTFEPVVRRSGAKADLRVPTECIEASLDNHDSDSDSFKGNPSLSYGVKRLLDKLENGVETVNHLHQHSRKTLQDKHRATYRSIQHRESVDNQHAPTSYHSSFDNPRPQGSSTEDWWTDTGFSGNRQSSHGFTRKSLRRQSNIKDDRFGQHYQDALFNYPDFTSPDISSDSNEDPFRYDNERYHNIVRLGREREVSQALKQLGHLETQVEAILEASGVDGFHENRTSITGEVPVQEKGTNLTEISRDLPLRVQRQGSFFDPVAFRALCDNTDGDDTNIKIQVNHAETSSTRGRESQGENSIFGL
ncbi:hypothetical protein BX600DRAFT_448251, partial [Xylariales sp. PMI_506]